MTSKLGLTIIVLVSIFLAFFVYPQAWDRTVGKIPHVPHFKIAPPFRLGLDLLGGAHLEYQADLSGLKDPATGSAGGQSPADPARNTRRIPGKRIALEVLGEFRTHDRPIIGDE